MPYDNAAFQLTPSRRATREHFCFPCRTAFQLTPSRRATIIEASAHRAEVISTHALTEGDVFSSVKSMHAFNFNSRPHGGRPRYVDDIVLFDSFQLTPSRRATGAVSAVASSCTFQLTPSRRATVTTPIILPA